MPSIRSESEGKISPSLMTGTSDSFALWMDLKDPGFQGSKTGEVQEATAVHIFLVYLDQDEIVLVTLQQEFASRDFKGVERFLAYVDRRLQSFPHLRACDLPSTATLLDIQPARADCRYMQVDDDGLRALRELEMSRAAQKALDGATAADAVRDMNVAINAIPIYVVAERERLRRDQPRGRDGEDLFASWASPASLALLEESHADLAARIAAAANVLDRYSLDPTQIEQAETGLGREAQAHGSAEPSGIWRKYYDRPRAS
jgi:hypothetical protein